MGGTISYLDAVALPVALMAWGYNMFWSESWTHTVSRFRYTRWRAILNSLLAFPGWVWMPFIFVMVGLAGSGAFLYMRNSFAGDERAMRLAIYSLFYINVFFFQFWTPLMLWGPSYWWGAALDSLMIFLSGLAIVILMGIERAFLPMGLWIGFTVLAGIVMLSTSVFWWYGNEIAVGAKNFAANFPGNVTKFATGGGGVFPPGFLYPQKTGAPAAYSRDIPMRQPDAYGHY